jgi:hypothetical protein
MKLWLSEVDFYNTVITLIMKGLSVCDSEVEDAVITGKIPQKWEYAARFVCTSELNQFILFLCAKRTFFVEKLTNPDVRKRDIRMVGNVRGFFAAHLHEYAFRVSLDCGALCHTFLPGGEPGKDDIVITGLWLMNADWEKGKLVFLKGPQARLFTGFPPLCCRIAAWTPGYGENNFICPLYKCVFLKDRISPVLLNMHDGETDNFVINVLLPTDFGDRGWLLNNVGLFCQVPTNLI